jgi:hypothetical protein
LDNWEGFVTQSRRFWEVAEAVNDPGHVNQAVSNAIHAVIAANDALCLRLMRRRPGGISHAAGARALQQACKGRPWEREAASHAHQYSQIVREKNAAEYEGQAINLESAQRIMTQSRRFLDWVEKVLQDPACG